MILPTSRVTGIVLTTALAVAAPVSRLLADATVIHVDVSKDRRPISPLIYGVNLASKEQLDALNAPLNRQGGNNFSTYNWRVNTLNLDSDWYYMSIPGFFLGQPKTLEPGQRADQFIADSRAAGAEPMITIPELGWIARVTDPNKDLYSYSVAKYGPQDKVDPENPDAGNGIKPGTKTPITGNDPNDAYVRSDVAYQRDWVRHLVDKWGKAADGGVPYYIMDNEPGLRHRTHQDIWPIAPTAQQILDEIIAYGSMVKSVDSTAQIVGPEEWNYVGFEFSPYDEQYRAAHDYKGHPDEDANKMPFAAWLLKSLHDYDVAHHQRLLDVFTFHIYPQGPDQNGGTARNAEIVRNRSTRSLWDRRYVDESWIKAPIMLIPRMRRLVDRYYPGTKIGITEYDWNVDNDSNGATAQADCLGIFGREGVDLANHWPAPALDSPVARAMQMYRNYDGRKSTFGDTSVRTTVPKSNDLSAFGAVRATDGALTVMVVNKQLDRRAAIDIEIARFAAGARAQAWQLTSANAIARLDDVGVTDGRIATSVPAQSITLFVVPAAR